MRRPYQLIRDPLEGEMVRQKIDINKDLEHPGQCCFSSSKIGSLVDNIDIDDSLEKQLSVQQRMIEDLSKAEGQAGQSLLLKGWSLDGRVEY
jgi:hypothetical protein